MITTIVTSCTVVTFLSFNLLKSCSSARSWVASPASSAASDGGMVESRSSIPQIDLEADDPRWTEIPLSDEDEQPSPRGVLQFRKASESDGGICRKCEFMRREWHTT